MQMTIIVHHSLSVIKVAGYLAVAGVMVIMTVEMILMNKNAVRGCVFYTYILYTCCRHIILY